MEIIFLLIIISVFFFIAIVIVFFWAIKSGQYEDTEGPAHRILLDDDNTVEKKQK